MKSQIRLYKEFRLFLIFVFLFSAVAINGYSQTVTTFAGNISYSINSSQITEATLSRPGGSHSDMFDGGFKVSLSNSSLSYTNEYFLLENTYGIAIQKVVISNSTSSSKIYSITSGGNLGSDGSTRFHYTKSTSPSYYTISSDQTSASSNGSDPVVSRILGFVDGVSVSNSYSINNDQPSTTFNNISIPPNSKQIFLFLVGVGSIGTNNSNRPDFAKTYVDTLIDVENWPSNFFDCLATDEYSEVINWNLQSGGTISSTTSVFCTSSTDPDAFTSTAAANGGSGVFSYQWQISMDGSSFDDILDATSETYNSGTISQTTYFRREATDTSNSSLVLYSNILTLEKFEIDTQPSTSDQTLATGATPTNLNVVVSNSTEATYQWYRNASNRNVGGTSMGSSYRSATFTPPTNTVSKWYYYVVVTKGGCSITSNVSGAVTVGRGMGNLTIVESGGDNIGTNWIYDNGVLTTTNSTASVNASVVEGYMLTSDLSVEAANITVNTNITSTSANNLTLKAKEGITLAASRSIATNGGDVIFWSDSDASGTTTAAGGTIALLDASSINTAGGNITLAGGLDDGGTSTGLSGLTASDGIPDGYAIGAYGMTAHGAVNATAGLSLDKAIINAGTGNVILRGQGTGNANNYQMGTRLYGGSISAKDISIDAIGSIQGSSSSSWGLSLEGFSLQGSGNIKLSGKGGRAGASNSDANQAGVEIRAAMDNSTQHAQVRATGNGTIAIKGIGGSGSLSTSNNLQATGIRIISNQTSPILSESGSITLEGTSGYSGGGPGILIQSPISSTNGAINLKANRSTEGTLNQNGNIEIQSTVTTGGNLTVESLGAVTQTAAITANGLDLKGTGNFTLTNASNNVTTIAGGDNSTRLGSIRFSDATGGLTVGSVNSTGINSSGAIEIATISGDLLVTEPIVSTLSTGDAVKLYADKDATAGELGDGQIKMSSNGAVTVESGARALLYSGKELESTGVKTAVGGESNIRYEVDTNTNLSTLDPDISATGSFGLFRIDNFIDITVTSQDLVVSKVYDGTNTATITNIVVSGIESGDEVTVSGTATYDNTNVGSNKAINVIYALGGSDGDPRTSLGTLTAGGASESDDKTYANISRWAQQFVATESGPISKIKLNLYRRNAQSGTFTVQLWSGSGSTPSVSLTTLKTLDWSSIPLNNSSTNTNTFVEFDTFDNSYSLISGNTYWIVVSQTSNGPQAKRWAAAGGGNQIASYNTNTSSWTNQGSSINLGYQIEVSKPSKYRVPSNFSTNTGEITQKAIEITAASDIKVFDGVALTKNNSSISGGSLVNSQTYTVTLTGSQTNVGSSTNVVSSAVIKDSSDNDVTANYNITYVNGSLEVTKRNITIIPTASQSKTYGESNTPLTYTISPSTLPNGTAITLGGTLSRTLGENAGTYSITLGSLSNSNYDLSLSPVDYTIHPKPITINITSKTKVFGAASVSLSSSTSGIISGDAASGTLTRTLGEDVGTYSITAGSLTYGPNYSETFIPGTLTISARTITVTAAAKTKVFGESDPELTYTATPAVGAPVVAGSAATVTFTGTLTRTAGENAGTYSITLGTLSNTNYTIDYVGADFSITKAPTDIEDGDSDPATETLSDTTITFGDADLLLTPTSSNTGDYTFTSSDSSVASITTTSTNTASIRNMGVGSAVISISQAADTNYQAKTVSYTLTVDPLAVTVTPTATQSKTYGEADLTLTYHSSPELNNSLSNSSTITFTGTLSRTAGENASTYSITIGSLTNTNYAITLTETDYTINQRPITISAEAKTKVYGSADPSLTHSITAGSIFTGDTVSGVLTRTSGEAAGTYSITQNTLTYGNNYNETYEAADLTITNATLTLTVSGYTKVYDSQFIDSSNLSFTATGLVNGNRIDDLVGTPTYTVVGTATNTVGTYSITLSGLSHPSYDIVFVGANATITPATLTITADTLSKTYGDADPTFTHTTEGLIPGDTFTGTLTRTAGENVGTYTISNNDLTYGNNYTENFVSGTLTITTKTITVTANAQTKVHGDVDPELTYTVSPAINTTLANNSSTITFTGTLTRTIGEDVGTYAIGIGTLTNTNFDVTFVPANLDITRLPVTITPTASQSKTYGDSDFTLAYTASPAVGSTLTNTTSTITFTGTLSRTTGENVGTYSITLGTVSNTNYNITLSPETFAINKKTVTVSGITAGDKVYDANTNASVDLSGINFDSLSFSDSITATVTGTFDTKDIGTAKTVSLSATYSSSALDNYTIVDQNSTTASITAKTVSVTGSTGINKTYDGNTNLPLGVIGYGSLTGVIGSEDVTLSGVGVYDAARVGSRTIAIGTVTLTGADKDNYSLLWTNGSGTISKKTLTVTANNDAKFVGESDTSGFNGVSYSGFEGSDSVSDINVSGLAITRSNSSQNDAGNYPGTLVPSGVVATNYDFNYVAGDYTIIPADKLLLRVANQTTTYGTAASYSITSAQYYKTGTGLVSLTVPTPVSGVYPINDGASTINIRVQPASPVNSTAGKLAVGSYGLSATVVSGSSGNFSNNIEVIGSHSVAKKSLTATASGVSKEYDATTSMSGVSLGLTGLESSDAVTVNGTGAFSSPSAGTGLSYTIAGLSLAGADADNYYLSAGASFSGANGVITKAPLTVTANNDNGVDTDPAYSGGNGVAYTGFKGLDGVSDLGGSLSYTGTSQGATAAGTYTIVPGGLTSSNYSITFVAGTLTIIVGDSDGDGVRDPSDNCPTTPNADQADADGDGVGDVCDNAPNTPNADQRDTDADGIGDVADPDDDNDGCPDTSDAFSLDPSECSDNDGDGIGDNADTDDDNDGVLDTIDNCAFTPNPTQSDIDLDGIGDVCDTDIDGDGWSNEQEQACGSNPTDATDTLTDFDQDGLPDCSDPDDDNDGVADVNDAFPLDATEWLDTDADGTGNNADTDDDNDGQSDEEEIFCGTDPLDASSFSGDVDADGITDCRDTDNDNDGVNDVSDAFPLDPAEWTDTDADGIGNNADTDDDGDGYSDLDELECNSNPLDANELPADLDGDGIPDCKDTDLDGDGCLNTEDVFPRDPSECLDTDGDGLGDNVDVDDDGDGVIDLGDAFPLDPTERADADGDGIGDNADPDDNNDGFDDEKLLVSGLLTPNSSGMESTWKIVNIEQYPNARVSVFDKNGMEVFRAQNYRNDWRGTYKNSADPLPAGSYYYVVQLNTGEEPIKGWLFISY